MRPKIEVEGFVDKDTLKTGKSKAGKEYGTFRLSYQETDEKWQKATVFCSPGDAEALLSEGFGKSEKGRRRINVRGILAVSTYTDLEGATRVSMTISRAEIRTCLKSSRVATDDKPVKENGFSDFRAAAAPAPAVADDDLFV